MVNQFIKKNYKTVFIIICCLCAAVLLLFDIDQRYPGLVILGLGMYLTSFFVLLKKRKTVSTDLLMQIVPFVLVPFLLWNEYTLYVRNRMENLWACVAGLIVFHLCFWGILILLFYRVRKEQLYKKAGTWLVNNIEIVFLMVLFAVLSIETVTAWMTNDGAIYTIGILNARNDWNFLNFDALNLGAHQGYMYGVLTLIADLWAPGQVVAVKVFNIILAILTSLAFHGIIKIICPDINRLLKAIFVALFAFSPWLFGMVGDINLEFPQLCFLTWVVYFHLKEKKVMRCFAGLCLCFTKETGFLLYGMYALGMFVGKMIEKREIPAIKRFITVAFRDMKGELLNGVLWCYTYVGFSSAMWGSTVEAAEQSVQNPKDIEGVLAVLNSFDIWPSYMFYKVKEILLINMGWLIWLVIVVLGLISMKKVWSAVKQSRLECTLAFVFSGCAFWAIQLFYITWTNYRYLSPMGFYQTILLCMVIYIAFTPKLFKQLLSLCLAVMVFATNYYTIGPTFGRFIERDFGNGKMVVPNLFALEYVTPISDSTVVITRTLTPEFDSKTGTRDCMEYNRQYSYFGTAFENFLAEINYTENDLIIIPNVLDDIEFMSHSIFYRDSGVVDQNLYWNPEKEHLNINTYISESMADNVSNEHLNIAYVDEGKSIKQSYYKKYDRIFYMRAELGQEFDHEAYTKDSFGEIYKIDKNVYSYPIYQLK